MSLDFHIQLNRLAAKSVVAVLVASACSVLSICIIYNFIIGALADRRAQVGRDTLTRAAEYFPNSARLHARLAAACEQESDLASAETHARRAINLSPYDYSFRLLLAGVQESTGDLASAEESLRTGLAFAPNKTEAQWRMANLLLRRGDLGQAVESFYAACSRNKKLLPVTLNMIWRASSGSLEAVEAATPNDPKARLMLAQFLLKQSQPEQSGKVFQTIAARARLATAETADYFNALLEADHLNLARRLWADLVGEPGSERPLLWNGSFESETAKELAQFDWRTYNNDYVRIKVSEGAASSGSRALRIDFTGRDTTRLDGEVKQLVVLKPGARYRFECYAKAEGLVTSEGPRVVVTAASSSEWIAATVAVASGQSNWQQLSTEFTAPTAGSRTASAFYVSIKRKPRFSYDEPTRGTIFFDDFVLKEEDSGFRIQNSGKFRN